MFGKRYRLGSSEARVGDERLSALLQGWKGLETHLNFEAAVWRRIRAAAVSEPRAFPAVTTLRDWFVPRSAWVNAMAAAAGIFVGVGLAFFALAARDGRHANEPLLQARTLAGSYITMVTGGTR